MRTPHFRPPYLARIVCQVGGHVVELARYRQPINVHTWRMWTDGREERCGIEAPLTDRQTITARPGCKTWHRSNRPLALGGYRAREWA